jgi:hypothetical protein
MPENHKMIEIPVTEQIEIKTLKDNLRYPSGFLIKDTSQTNVYRMIREN